MIGKMILAGGVLISFASATLMAQGRPAGPPSSSGVTSDAARSIANIRARNIGDDFADRQFLSASERADFFRVDAQQRRADAQATAAAAQSGTLRHSSATIRNAMKGDMDVWRSAFQVRRAEWQAMREQWLIDRDSLTATQWAQRRLDWMAARDAWIANPRT